LENSLEEVIYGHGRWGFWRSSNTIFEIYSYSSCYLQILNYNKTQDTNNLKINKNENINKSIIALFAVVACLAA
jgi:hypothetical protein